jgi:hypothetical protein
MPRRRSTIGTSPLDVLFDHGASAIIEVPRPPSNPDRGAPSAPPTAARTSSSRRRVTVHVPGQLIDRVRDAVWWTPGLTLAAFTERALETALRAAETERGCPFPPRTGRLRSGPPLS